ncbi:MAG: Gldg family protein, partial [Gammaproteobacteria bacterium]
MDHHAGIDALLWFGGWLGALAILFSLGVSLSLTRSRQGWRRGLHQGILVSIALALAALADVALSLHDAHFDLTREKLFTPAPAALEVIDRLDRPVSVTYFYRNDDPNGKRARDILQIMARRNRNLTARAVDPDRAPALAADLGVKIYNAAVIEAEDRRVIIRGTDETEFAIGIQRVLRERTIEVCFIEGHGEYASNNYEFHTHLDSAIGHSHDDPQAQVIDTTQHGYGRFRRSLEGLGFDVRVADLAQPGGIAAECRAVIEAGPRTTFTPGESAALTQYLVGGGSALLMLDLGFELDRGLVSLLARLGLELPPAQIIDPEQHQGTDRAMVNVTAYVPHPITRNVSYTFFPGARPLVIREPSSEAKPLAHSSASSVTHSFQVDTERALDATAASFETTGPQLLAAAAEGRLAPHAQAFRAVVVGDADFA